MRRYQGEVLAPGCRIAVIANDALGNYVVTTPLLEMLRERHRPSCLDYFCGSRTEELWRRDSKIDHGFSAAETSAKLLRKDLTGEYDLVVNIEDSPAEKTLSRQLASSGALVIGPCFTERPGAELPHTDDWSGRLASDPDWTASDLCERHSCLETGFIGEILCRIAYLTGNVPAYSVPHSDPDMSIPDVLVATAASLPQKLWHMSGWVEAVEWLGSQGVSVGLLGAKPEDQRRHWFGHETEEKIVACACVTDMRGKLSLPEVVGALRRARLCFTLDNGVLHLAVAAQTPTVGIFRDGIHRLWAPRVSCLEVLTPGQNREVGQIETAEVIQSLNAVLSHQGKR